MSDAPSAPVRVLRRARTGALAGLSLALPLSLAASNALWGLALAAAVGLWIWDPPSRRFERSGLEIPFLVYLGVEILTSLLSDRPGHSLGKIKSEVLAVVFLLYAQTPDEKKRFLALFLAGAGLAAVLGLAQKAIGWTAEDAPAWAGVLRTHRGRAQGFYSNPITYAEMLLLALFLALAWARADRSRWARGAFLVSAAAAAVVASATRAVWIAAPLGLAAWAALRRDRFVAGTLALVVAVGAAGFSLSPALRSRAVGLAAGSADSSRLIRQGVWLESLRLVRERPIRGVGIGNLHIPGSALRWGGARPDTDWTEAHNIYLQMAVERGLPGLAVFLWLLARAAGFLRRAASADALWNGLLFGGAALAVAGLAESWTHDSEVMLCVYALLGMAARSARGVAPPPGKS